MHFEFQVEGGNFSKAGTASSQLKKILKQLNVDSRDIKRVVVALYEAEVNVVAHAYQGVIIIDIDTEKIRIRIEDEGPGIKDIDLAMQQGFSTASELVREMGFGAGMGLPNIKNNTDELTVTSEVGKGTNVHMLINFSI
ncbi:MAG: anti-sigma regulatory factor [Lentimicrobium sp.]|nr:anti-sigma regulatory factor [Lentimicrobium sp.]MDD2526528.1 anti-sigma regulatory factor [Lentimicrobiaceae bacterium]MDD4596338.1 anti-sigma regulatory factor [Lentimicrobiaceae bacterium]MDY0025539.1 anti-sigma regulatory factor [Lentimicrobium sp.]HAH58298.1 anti-sigma regulatory factor [Bacteroidales bacterium]